MSPLKPSIPQGSLVLITGITGFVAGHVAKQFLERGYRVRGTVRHLSAASWLVDDVFKTYSARGDLELAVVPDLGDDHAFDDAVKGVSAIAHVALSDVVPYPDMVIDKSVKGMNSILEAAIDEPSVREFVFTGSIAAGGLQLPGVKTFVDKNTFNDDAVERVRAAKSFTVHNFMDLYSASKVEAEKALRKFAKDRKPHFNINVISPASILGEPLNIKHANNPAGYNTGYLRLLYHGDVGGLVGALPAMFVINVKDVAVLHVAAVLDHDTKDERIQVWGYDATWNDIIAILRKMRPKRTFVWELPHSEYLSLSADFGPGLALLKKWGNQDAWKSVEESVADSLVLFD